MALKAFEVAGSGGLVNANVSGANINIDVAKILTYVAYGIGGLVLVVGLYFLVKKIFSGFAPEGSIAGSKYSNGEKRKESNTVIREMAAKAYDASGYSRAGNEFWTKVTALNNADLRALNNYYNKQYYKKDASWYSSDGYTFYTMIKSQDYGIVLGEFIEQIQITLLKRLESIGVTA